MLQLTAQVAAAIAGDHDYCHLIRLELANNTIVRLTDAGFDINWNGEAFDANGLLLGMDAPTFNTQLRIGEIQLSFTAADQSIVALMLGQNQINRYVYVYRAYLTNQGVVIPDPILLHTWLITASDVSDSNGSAVCSVAMASEWADFEKPSGRRSTNASQQRFYPGDKGMEFSGQINKDLKWGGA
jgi:hypothetical protein